MLDTLKLRKVEPETLDSCDVLKSVWSVNLGDADDPSGYVASSKVSYTIRATGEKKYAVQWGFAVDKDEFRSGIMFLYMNRKTAIYGLLKSINP